MFRVLEETAAQFGSAIALHQPYFDGGKKKYRTWTFHQYKVAAEEIAAGLRSLGVGRGDVVALDSETRAEFYLSDLGILTNGSIAAALYTTLPTQDLLRTMRVIRARALFAEDAKTLRSLRNCGVPHLILLTGEAANAITLDQLRERGRAAIAADPGLLARIHAEVQPSDDAILYLTSGATGEPKMVMVSHAAIVSNLDMGPAVLPLGPAHSTVAFLPSAHIAQRVVIELLPLRMGMPVWFAESLTKLPHDLKFVRPTLLLAPPRLWERIYSTICTEIRKRKPVAQKLFYAALGLGHEAAKRRQDGRTVPAWIRLPLAGAHRLVFAKIRERFGGRITMSVSGAAPLGKDLAEFYAAVGMPLIEGYGLTEGGVVSMNPMARPKAGSIGKPLPGVEVRIAEDGELLVRSPCLFSRYLNDPAATEEVLREGWLYTGDVAHLDEDGYIYITGRKKDLIVSSTGKKIFPSRVENLFQFEPLISQVLLVGDRLPYLTALFTMNQVAAEAMAGMESWKGRPAADLATAPPLISEVQKLVARVNKQLAPWEQIRKYRILDRDFTIEQGELTPTMKIRRTRVMENFRAQIDELYAGKEEFR